MDPMTMAMVASTVLGTVGKLKEGDAAMKSGRRRQMAAEYQAEQLERNAGQEIAASQRTAIEDRRNATLAQSRALAVAAASGGGSDPTVVNLIARLAGEGTYRAMSSLYGGQERARSMRDQAAATRYSGEVAMDDARTARSAARFGAMTTAMTGAASMYSRFGKQTDPATNTAAESFGGVSYDLADL